jgi:two-component system LytT family response regulator
VRRRGRRHEDAVSRTLRALVADDDTPARAHLCRLLGESGVRVVAECASGRAVLAALATTRCDLVCLDVRMPDLDGLAVARGLAAARRPVVVFTTGFADYAAAAYDLDAADYLLKPLSAARVREAIRRVRLRLRAGDPEEGADVAGGHAPAGPREMWGARGAPELRDGPTPVGMLDPGTEPDPGGTDPGGTRRPLPGRPALAVVVPRLFLTAGDHHLAVPPEAISYIEARGTTCVVYGDAGAIAVRAPLGRFERVLCAHGFLRTHRAYLVNLRRVRALVPWSRHVHTLLLDGPQETHVPVAKSRLAAFRRSVIWLAAGGAHGAGLAGPRGDRGRREPGVGPRDR